MQVVLYKGPWSLASVPQRLHLCPLALAHISATSALDNTSHQLIRDVDWLRNAATGAINVTGRDSQSYVAHKLIADSFVASRTIQRKAL